MFVGLDVEGARVLPPSRSMPAAAAAGRRERIFSQWHTQENMPLRMKIRSRRRAVPRGNPNDSRDPSSPCAVGA